MKIIWGTEWYDNKTITKILLRIFIAEGQKYYGKKHKMKKENGSESTECQNIHVWNVKPMLKPREPTANFWIEIK